MTERATFTMPRLSYTVACAAALFGMFLTRWLTNRFVFALYDTGGPWLRDLAVLASVMALAGVALIALWKPHWLSGNRVATISGAALVAGSALVALAVQSHALGAPLWIGAIAADIGSGLVCLCACIACIKLPECRLAPCVALAYLASYLARPLFAGISPLMGFGFFGAAALATLCVALIPAVSQLGSPSPDTPAPAQSAVTRPATYVPLRHPLFVLLLVFEVVYGYATTTAAPSPAIAVTPLVIALLGLVCAGSFWPRAMQNPDWLFIASVLTVLAGILGLPLAAVAGEASLQAGSGLFQILAFFLLIDLGHRNEANGLAVIAWGSAVMSFGVIAGANAAKLTGPLDIGTATCAPHTAVAAFVLAAAALMLQQTFSIRATLEGIEDASVEVVPPPSDATVEDHCREIGERFGLTAREQEVFALLARGRNSPFIQEALGISYNTARTHVRHIYEKCGFHTQQELIDAVDRA